MNGGPWLTDQEVHRIPYRHETGKAYFFRIDQFNRIQGHRWSELFPRRLPAEAECFQALFLDFFRPGGLRRGVEGNVVPVWMRQARGRTTYAWAIRYPVQG